jgi:non-ribosomal peptide synthetase component F
VQYADYAVWQHSWLNKNSPALKRQIAYWKSKLGAAPAPLQLPRRVAQPRTPDLNNCLILCEPSDALTSQLIVLGKQAIATLFATLLGSFKAALQRRFGQEDILLGTYTGARTHPDTAELIGHFVNLLPLRTSLSGDPTFWELVGRVRETTLDAYSHAELPFEELSAALRTAGCSPPEVTLIFELKESEYEQNIADLEVCRIRRSDTSVMPWGMTVRLSRQHDKLSGRVSFDSDLYDPQGVAQLVGDWMQLLEMSLKNPDRRLSQLQMPLRRRAA